MTYTVQVEGHLVRYQVIGEGEPLVLVHGLSGSTLWWRRNVAALASRYRVYLVDLPGFGSMHFPRSRFVLKEAASWLLLWIRAIGLEKVHLVGHSMGGYISLWIAAHHPEIVDRLVLVAPAVMPKIKTVMGYLLPLALSVRYVSPPFLLILAYDALRAGPLTLLRAAHDLLALDVRQEMKAISAPTLLIWGENDLLVPPVLAHVVHSEIKNSELLILSRAGHVCMFDQPERFNKAVLAFLQGDALVTQQQGAGREGRRELPEPG